MYLFLVRHGEAVKTSKDSVLTPKGIVQAQNVARFFDSLSCDAVFMSSLTRAQQTAHELLAKRNDLSAVEMPELNEIYRVLVGGPAKEGTSPERERLDKIRADSVYDWLFTLKNKNVLLFTHGNLIRYLIAKTLSASPLPFWKNLDILPGSISVIKIEGDKARLKTANGYAHQAEFMNDFFN